MNTPHVRSRSKLLLEVFLVIFVLVVLVSVLMPTLGRSREIARSKILSGQWGSYGDAPTEPMALPAASAQPTARYALAHVKSFKADIVITPKLSIGTSEPEKIYEAAFTVEIAAINPSASKGECELTMPLPPQIISLSDLEITVNAEPSENVTVRDGVLVWHGQLDETKATPITIKYTAVGRGIYTLNTPPGKIVDLYEVVLTANKSDLRMMELSLQPVSFKREEGKTVYEWRYKRLMYGRPIALDVLGLAPRDQLAGIIWLGPVSVVVFGVLVALFSIAYAPDKLDKWMLLLLLGTFAAAYPLMYFAQDFLTAPMAVAVAAAAMMVVIAARSDTLFGLVRGIIGPVALAAGAMGLTLWVALVPESQGVILTAGAIATFVLGMILLPRAQKSLAAAAPTPPPAPPEPVVADESDG